MPISVINDYVSNDLLLWKLSEKEIQLKFNNLTWSKMVEYQKRYSNLLNKYSDIYQDTERLNKFVDSLILTEFPEINKFTEEIFKLRYN